MSNAPALAVQQIKRSYCIVAGVSVLGKYRTEQQALDSLENNRAHFEYWAGSGGVSMQNSQAVVVRI